MRCIRDNCFEGFAAKTVDMHITKGKTKAAGFAVSSDAYKTVRMFMAHTTPQPFNVFLNVLYWQFLPTYNQFADDTCKRRETSSQTSRISRHKLLPVGRKLDKNTDCKCQSCGLLWLSLTMLRIGSSTYSRTASCQCDD